MLVSHGVFISIFLLIAGLGFFVLLRNPANIVNKRFCFFAFAISVWIFFIFFVLNTTDPVSAASRLKLGFSAAIFIPSTFFYFSSVFPDRAERPIDKYLSISFFTLSALLAFSSSNIVESVSFVEQWPHAKYGPLFPLFWFYFIFCMAYSFYLLYKKSIHYYGIKRLQVQYLYFGVAISVFLGSITNFLLPTLGIWQVETFVPLVAIPIPIAVSYAIIKYHLMDISLVIKRSAVYGTLSILLVGVYFSVGLILSKILPVSEYKDTIKVMVSTTVMVLTFVPARESIQYIVEKTLFRTNYSYPKILSTSTIMFSSIHDLDRLLRYAIQYLYNSVGIEKICILLKDEKTKHYSLRTSINFSLGDNSFIPSQDPIVTWLCQNRTVLSRDQLHRFMHSKHDHLLEDTLSSLNVDSCIPILQENDLFGIIFLGKKVNKKIYTQEDIQMFLAFSGQLAMAANNACLYSGLQEAKTYRDNILQSLKSGVIVVDNNEEVTIINNEAKRILGLENTTSSERILKSFGNDAYKLLKYTLKSNTEHNDIEIFIERDNKKVPCGVTVAQLNTEAGEKLGALMIVTDLTELKLLRAEKQHADRLAYLGGLAANIAHEIKNPLVAINTYFQLLPHKKDDAEFNNDFQKIALKEIGRINRIIEELLNLVKPSKPFMNNIDPHIAIKDTISLLKNTASEKGVEITTAFEKTKCLLIADEDKLKQVVINILQNSLDALPKNGLICVSTSYMKNLSEFRSMAKERPSYSVFFSFASPVSRSLNDKQYFVIKISDNGMGIPAENIQHIFEPFFSNKEKGTGLGLAMVYRIIKDHEGGIYVESKEGIGTDFYISLPLNPISTYKDISPSSSKQKTTEIPSTL